MHSPTLRRVPLVGPNFHTLGLAVTLLSRTFSYLLVWSYYSGINYVLTAILWEVGIHLYKLLSLWLCLHLRVAALLYYRKLQSLSL
jgi:hypothetical protein